MGHVSDILIISTLCLSTNKTHTDFVREWDEWRKNTESKRKKERERARERNWEQIHIKTQPFQPAATYVARSYSSPLFEMTFESYLICGFCSCFWMNEWMNKKMKSFYAVDSQAAFKISFQNYAKKRHNNQIIEMHYYWSTLHLYVKYMV